MKPVRASKLANDVLQLQERIGDVIGIVSTLETLAELIDEGEWATAVTQGSTLSPTEAVAYATRGRGAKGRPAFGRDSLTRVELEVANLVAIGLSNPEIAEQLMVSVKTVATHLTHIYRKVPCSDRRELRRLARERAQPVPDAG